MPRRKPPGTAAAATSRPAGPFIVRNPRGIPAGRHILRFHRHAEDREDPSDHSGCSDQRWFEGDTLEPPDGFGLDRFLQHQPAENPPGDCGEESCPIKWCAGPFLEEVSADG